MKQILTILFAAVALMACDDEQDNIRFNELIATPEGWNYVLENYNQVDIEQANVLLKSKTICHGDSYYEEVDGEWKLVQCYSGVQNYYVVTDDSKIFLYTTPVGPYIRPLPNPSIDTPYETIINYIFSGLTYENSWYATTPRAIAQYKDEAIIFEYTSKADTRCLIIVFFIDNRPEILERIKNAETL